jgi:hypothetical protein
MLAAGTLNQTQLVGIRVTGALFEFAPAAMNSLRHIFSATSSSVTTWTDKVGSWRRSECFLHCEGWSRSCRSWRRRRLTSGCGTGKQSQRLALRSLEMPTCV